MESTFYSILERHEDGRDQWLQHTQTSAISEHANMYGFYPLWDEVTFIDRHKVVYFKTIFHFQVMFGLNIGIKIISYFISILQWDCHISYTASIMIGIK